MNDLLNALLKLKLPVALPLVAGIVGMLCPAALFLDYFAPAVYAGHDALHLILLLGGMSCLVFAANASVQLACFWAADDKSSKDFVVSWTIIGGAVVTAAAFTGPVVSSAVFAPTKHSMRFGVLGAAGWELFTLIACGGGELALTLSYQGLAAVYRRIRGASRREPSPGTPAA